LQILKRLRITNSLDINTVSVSQNYTEKSLILIGTVKMFSSCNLLSYFSPSFLLGAEKKEKNGSWILH
jgi:hypothetical protein